MVIDVMQSALNFIETWCKSSSSAVNPQKIVSLLFTSFDSCINITEYGFNIRFRYLVTKNKVKTVKKVVQGVQRLVYG